MPAYEYTALNWKGEDVVGRIEATDIGDAISKLRRKKFSLFEVKIAYGLEPTQEQRKDYRKRFYRMPYRGQNSFTFIYNRILGKIRVKAFNRQQELRRQKLLPKKDDIIRETFRILDRHLRNAWIAQIGGFRPAENILNSWFGDVLVCKKGENWPKWYPCAKGEVFLTPLAQFNLTEVPYLPEKLRRFKMITVFMDYGNLPVKKVYGEGWVVRGYESFDDLVPIERPNVTFAVKAFPIRWNLLENEGPNWEDAWKITDLSDFNLIAHSEFHDRYKNSEHTKLGGYPALIQGELDFGTNDFVFQIGSEEKAGWYWGDGGIGYFGFNDEGEWLFEWTCY